MACVPQSPKSGMAQPPVGDGLEDLRKGPGSAVVSVRRRVGQTKQRRRIEGARRTDRRGSVVATNLDGVAGQIQGGRNGPSPVSGHRRSFAKR